MTTPINPVQDQLADSMKNLARRAYDTWVAETEWADAPPLDTTSDQNQAAWAAVVNVIRQGAYCADCLALLHSGGVDGITMRATRPSAGQWTFYVYNVEDIDRLIRDEALTYPTFSTYSGLNIGMYSLTEQDGLALCATHNQIRIMKDAA